MVVSPEALKELIALFLELLIALQKIIELLHTLA